MYRLPYQWDSVFVCIFGPLFSNKAPKQLKDSDLTVCQLMGVTGLERLALPKWAAMSLDALWERGNLIAIRLINLAWWRKPVLVCHNVWNNLWKTRLTVNSWLKRKKCNRSVSKSSIWSLSGVAELWWTAFFLSLSPSPFPPTFPQKAADSLCTSRLDNWPPVEGSTWCSSYKQIQSAYWSWGGRGVFVLITDWNPLTCVCWVSPVVICWRDRFKDLGRLLVWAFFFSPKYSVNKKTVWTLFNFLSGFAKLNIWLMCKNRAQNSGIVEPVSVLEGLLKA